jgi:2-oxoglutarate ferredoxin oxidoreductase subunit alpha
MSETITKKKTAADTYQTHIINDFSMTIATTNGSGSQTSNLTLLRALFKMGIPVSGKNLFPSNIQGLPTWYTIRVSKDGYLARRDVHEIVVAMNPNTFAEDQQKVTPGGVFIYADHIKQAITREDVFVYSIPAKELAKNSQTPANLRDYIANMVYVGVLAQLLGIQMDKVKLALDFHFKGKERPVNLNFDVIQAAARWTEEHIEKKDPFFVEEMDMTKDCILTDGNTASALGAIYGGVQFCSWYPITPATSLAEELTHYLHILRDDPDSSEKNYAVLQSEDELAAIGMAVGAGWAGLRSMTSTSGPGISLMTEFVGLAYFAEVPIVIWDVSRVGPSTGLPTRTSQGDLTAVYYLGHGDTHHVVLLPSSAKECFEFGWKSFDIAERLQTPVFVLSDLDLGMNQWMTEEFRYPDVDMDRGKVLWEEDLEKWKKEWGRYMDVDGDGIPYRTIPGNQHPKASYFARGTGHDEFATYSEDNEIWERNMKRLEKKFETARQYIPKPVLTGDGKADVGIIAFGSTEPAIIEAMDLLNAEDIHIDYLRIRGLPLLSDIREFIVAHKHVYVVELNQSGQLNQILNTEFGGVYDILESLTKHDGLPLTAEWLFHMIKSKEQK